MRKLTYTIIPQRSSTSGWVECEPHQAERFAVMEVKAFTRNGRPYRTSRRVASFTTIREAAEEHIRLTQVAKPLSKPGLGQRFRKTGRKIIAQSLSYDQYHGLRSGRTDKEA